VARANVWLFLDVINHPITSPRKTIINGDTFIYSGSINMLLQIGGNHDRALPAIIDIDDRNSIGATIIGFSSIIFILGLDDDDHMVTNLNRIE